MLAITSSCMIEAKVPYPLYCIAMIFSKGEIFIGTILSNLIFSFSLYIFLPLPTLGRKIKSTKTIPTFKSVIHIIE